MIKRLISFLKKLSNASKGIVSAVITLGLLLSGFVFVVLYDNEVSREFYDLSLDAQIENNEMKLNLEYSIEAVRSLAAFYRASDHVDRMKFEKYSSIVLLSHPNIQAISWAPRVSLSERKQFEATTNDEGLVNFSITEKSKAGVMVNADQRDEYFPVHYIYPTKGNEAAIGFDNASDPSRREALNMARDTGELQVTKRITLVQETGNSCGVLVIFPIYEDLNIPKTIAERQDQIRGFATAVLRISDILLTQRNKTKYKSYVFDLSGEKGEQLLFPKGSNIQDSTDLKFKTYVQKSIKIGGISWVSIHGEDEIVYNLENHSVSIIVLLVLTSLSFFSAYYARNIIQQKILLPEKKRQTRELNKVRKEQESIANDLTQLIDTANAPIFGIDAAGLVNEWNQRAELLTGFEKTDVMGKDLVVEFITDDYKDSVKEVLDKALKGEETANYEFPLFSKSGDRIDVLLNSTSRRDSSGNIVGVVGVGQDITELKNFQQQVIHSSKLAILGEMTTSVAHELNQPLNVIRIASGNIRRKISKGTADIEYLDNKLERIEGQTARAAAIIDHMRMFGRKTGDEPEQIDPRRVVTNALDLMGEQLRLAGIEIVTKFPDTCSLILGHTIQLEQVILNLLANARDAMAERDGEPKITLRVFEDENGVHVSSQDTGGGIPEEVIHRIFEPFYTTKEMGKGTGLGLSVSYGIIRDMNGTIIVENIEDGARFTIACPAAT